MPCLCTIAGQGSQRASLSKCPQLATPRQRGRPPSAPTSYPSAQHYAPPPPPGPNAPGCSGSGSARGSSDPCSCSFLGRCALSRRHLHRKSNKMIIIITVLISVFPSEPISVMSSLCGYSIEKFCKWLSGPSVNTTTGLLLHSHWPSTYFGENCTVNKEPLSYCQKSRGKLFHANTLWWKILDSQNLFFFFFGFSEKKKKTLPRIINQSEWVMRVLCATKRLSRSVSTKNMS